MEIRGIKLVTGEELVAEVIGMTDDSLTIKNPLLLRVSVGKEGLVVNFMPWTIIADGDMDINLATVISSYPVPKDVEDNYISNTTGLQIVSGATPQILHG